MQEKQKKKHDADAAGKGTKPINADENEMEKASDAEVINEQTDNNTKAIDEDINNVKAELVEKSRKCDDVLNILQRTTAEYENFRKRTAKEKESLYTEAVSDVIAAFLPVMDNIERAVQACSDQGGDNSIREGVDLIQKQVNQVMKKLEVEEIKSFGEEFNPEVHNAVMHIEDEAYGKNIVMEEFQKGYIYKGKVIRYSMVKVAN